MRCNQVLNTSEWIKENEESCSFSLTLSSAAEQQQPDRYFQSVGSISSSTRNDCEWKTETLDFEDNRGRREGRKWSGGCWLVPQSCLWHDVGGVSQASDPLLWESPGNLCVARVFLTTRGPAPRYRSVKAVIMKPRSYNTALTPRDTTTTTTNTASAPATRVEEEEVQLFGGNFSSCQV